MSNLPAYLLPLYFMATFAFVFLVVIWLRLDSIHRKMEASEKRKSLGYLNRNPQA